MKRVVNLILGEKLPEWFELPKDTLHATDMFTAMNYYIDNKDIKILYLDHDLGKPMSKNTRDGSEWLDYVSQNYRVPEKVFCISLNPTGVERIKNVCNDHYILFENIGRKMMSNEVLAGGNNQITLTAYQIFEIANFAGLEVKEPDDDDKDTEFTLNDRMKIIIEDDNREYAGLGIICTEYPEEGALPLHSKDSRFSG